MEVLGHSLVRLGSRLVQAVAAAFTKWSLDTVNTDPLTQIARAGENWICFRDGTRASSEKKNP